MRNLSARHPEVLEWYGVDVSEIPADAALIEVERTHVIGFATEGHGTVQLPLALDPGIDLRRTTYLSRMIQRWGKLPLMLLNAWTCESPLRLHRNRGLVHVPGPAARFAGADGRDAAARSPTRGWTNEFERPIYFFEHRDG